MLIVELLLPVFLAALGHIFGGPIDWSAVAVNVPLFWVLFALVAFCHDGSREIMNRSRLRFLGGRVFILPALLFLIAKAETPAAAYSLHAFSGTIAPRTVAVWAMTLQIALPQPFALLDAVLRLFKTSRHTIRMQRLLDDVGNLVRKDPRAGIALLDRYVAEHPRDRSLLVGRARYHLIWNELDAARAVLTQVITDDPEVYVAKGMLAWAHAIADDQTKRDEALDYSLQALQKYPTDMELVGFRGAVLLWTGDRDNGLRCLEDAFDRLNDGSFAAILARDAAEHGDRERAEMWLARARKRFGYPRLITRATEALESLPHSRSIS